MKTSRPYSLLYIMKPIQAWNEMGEACSADGNDETPKDILEQPKTRNRPGDSIFKTDNIIINVILRRVCVTIFAVEK